MISRGRLALLFELVGNGATLTSAAERILPEHDVPTLVGQLDYELHEFSRITGNSYDCSTLAKYIRSVEETSLEYAQWLREGHHRLQPTWAWNSR